MSASEQSAMTRSARAAALGALLAIACDGPPPPGPDAGPDAQAPRADAGPSDAGTPGADAGSAPDAGPTPEICTPSVPGSVATDEDADGAIDEGCRWHFGVPHVVTQVHPPGLERVESAHLSADGLRLYFVACAGYRTGCAARVAARPSPSAPFGTSAPLPGDFEGWDVGGIALAPGELELYCDARRTAGSADFDIHRATRASTADPFGPLEPVSALIEAGTTGREPGLSSDGLEIVFARDLYLMRASRAALDEPFSEPERLTGLGVAVMAAPELTEDGLTLFFQGNRDPGAEHTRPFVARRAGTRSAAFEAAAPVLPDLDTVEEWMPFVSLDTQEIFFSGFGGAGVASPSLYRARVCRDGPCPPQEIECPSGTRSPDRLRCYTSSATTSTYAEASARCGASAGGHLATIHSASEQALVTTLAGADRVWIGLEAHDGAFLWETGEPLLFTDWARDQPDTSLFADCAALSPGSEAGRWSSVLCGAPLRAVCEAELWPSW